MSSTASDTTTASEGPWHRDVSPQQWRIFWASTLGWLFDGYEGYALLIAGLLVASFGGHGVAASVFAVLCLLVLPALRFLPETTGQGPAALTGTPRADQSRRVSLGGHP